MDKQQFLQLKNFTFSTPYYPRDVKLSDIATWALWNPEDKYDTSVIEQNIDKLNPNVMFVALNFAGDGTGYYLDQSWWKDWQNFHGDKTQTDKKLYNMLSGTKFEGSYLTDLFKCVPTRSSVELSQRVKNDEIDLENQINLFKNEIGLLNSDHLEIYLMGYETERLFKKYFLPHVKDDIESYKRILHTSNYHGSNEQFYAKVRQQLGLD